MAYFRFLTKPEVQYRAYLAFFVRGTRVPRLGVESFILKVVTGRCSIMLLYRPLQSVIQLSANFSVCVCVCTIKVGPSHA